MIFLYNDMIFLYSSRNKGTRTTCIDIDESQNLMLNETRKPQKKINPFLCKESNKQYIGDKKLGNNKIYYLNHF